MLTKFRCRNLKTHEIVAYEVIQDNTWMVSHDDNFEKWSRGTWWVDCIREQFTGLLDKNGNEIYEGDIVKVADTSICIVDFHAGQFVFSIQNPDPRTGGKRYCNESVYFNLQSEIIGNTLSNPELLK